MIRAWIRLTGRASIVLALAACASSPPEPASQSGGALPSAPVGEGYAELARGGGTVYRLDPARSTVRIYVFRGGAAAKMGHDHVFAAPRFEGLAYVPAGEPSPGRFDVRVRLEDLALDDPAWRAATGDSFSGQRSAEDIAGTRRNMLGPKGFDAEHFPDVRLSSVAVRGDWPILVADVAVTLHGVTRQQTVMLEVRRGERELKVSGAMTLRQSDFGVAPFTVLGGLLAVQDDVAIRFDLVGAPATAGS